MASSSAERTSIRSRVRISASPVWGRARPDMMPSENPAMTAKSTAERPCAWSSTPDSDVSPQVVKPTCAAIMPSSASPRAASIPPRRFGPAVPVR